MSASYRACLRAITLASSLAVLAAPALAQSATPVVPAPGTSGSTSAPAKSASASVNPLTVEDVSKLKGVAVYGGDNQKIGEISTVLMKPETKTIDRLVVGEGGILGVGARNVALPISAFSWDAQTGSFKIARTGDELKSMPEWREQVSEAPGGNTDTETRMPSGGVAPGAAAPAPSPATGSVGR
jgi:sporulation protein YlmC with PRC-barrel domain